VYNFVVVRIKEDITHASVKAKSERDRDRKKERKRETETERKKERERQKDDEYEEVLSPYLSRRRRRDRWKHGGIFPDEIFQSHLFHALYIFRDSRFAFELELRQWCCKRVRGGWRG